MIPLEPPPFKILGHHVAQPQNASRHALGRARATFLARLDNWLRHHGARASAKSPLGEALTYIAKYRDGLGRFLIYGGIVIDNNTPSHRYFVSMRGGRGP